eukprot:c39226_g1_i1.p1 GENE.c39226_g1_i1~~c39226_g1_i1.p1  ORF type:complete len:312 (+),score=40.00 c39226_g1_i1:14-949(+)
MGENIRMHFDPAHPHTSSLRPIMLGCAWASVAGSSFVIASYIRFKKLRRMPFDLIFNKSCADLLFSTSILLSLLSPDQTSCIVAGVLMNLAQLCSDLWTAIISYFLYKIVVMDVSRGLTLNTFYFKVFAFSAPVIFTLPILSQANNDFGMGKICPGWCWITPEHHNLRLYCGFLLPIVLLFFNCAYVGATVFHLLPCHDDSRNRSNSTTVSMQSSRKEPLLPAINRKRLIARLSLYLVVYFVLVFLAAGHRLAEYVNGSVTRGWLQAHAITECLTGLLDALAYGSNLINFNRFRWTGRADANTSRNILSLT